MSLKLAVDLKKLRLDRKLSARALGVYLGIHRNGVTRIERGEIPKLETALNVASFFGIKIRNIWKDSEEISAGREGAGREARVHSNGQEGAKQPDSGAYQTSIGDSRFGPGQ